MINVILSRTHVFLNQRVAECLLFMAQQFLVDGTITLCAQPVKCLNGVHTRHTHKRLSFTLISLIQASALRTLD